MEQDKEEISSSQPVTSSSETNTNQLSVQQLRDIAHEGENRINQRQLEELDRSIRAIRKALATLPTSVMRNEFTKTFYADATVLIAAETKAREILFRELNKPPGDLENPTS